MKLPAKKPDNRLVAYIGLGANLGDRVGTICRALREIEKSSRLHIGRLSSLYETAPVGPVAQPDFLNAVAQIEFEMLPIGFLFYLQKIEALLGRKRTLKWGPRTIDLDILLVENYSCQTHSLVLPHPEMTRRAFVLAPLTEIDPQLMVPGHNQTAETLLALCKDENRVKPFMAADTVWNLLKEV